MRDRLTDEPRMVLARLLEQRREIEPRRERPDLPHPVLGRQELIQAYRPQLDLPPLRRAQPRRPRCHLARRRRLRDVHVPRGRRVRTGVEAAAAAVYTVTQPRLESLTRRRRRKRTTIA